MLCAVEGAQCKTRELPKSCYITRQPSQLRADIKSDRILANRQEVKSVCASVYNIAIPPPPPPTTL